MFERAVEQWVRAGQGVMHVAPWRRFAVTFYTRDVPVTLIGSGTSMSAVSTLLGLDRQAGFHERPATIGTMRARIHRAVEAGAIVIARLPRGLAWSMADLGVHAPEMVDSVIDLVGGQWRRPRSARSNLRRINETGLTWRFSCDTSDFVRFYEDSYLPYLRVRHGRAAHVRNRHWLRLQFRQGGIQDVEHEGVVLASQLVVFRPPALECLAIGVGGDDALARSRGAVAATTAFAVELAIQRGLTQVNLGGSLPWQRDPILLSKSYWGARIAERVHADHELLLAWPAWTPAVAEVIERLAPIVRSRLGLVGLGTRPAPLPHGLADHLHIGSDRLPCGSSLEIARRLRDLSQRASP